MFEEISEKVWENFLENLKNISTRERLWYVKVLSQPLATIEQCRISFNRNTMVDNYHFIREGHLWQLSP